MQLISAQLYQYLQSVQAYIAPPVAAAFLLGVLWRRANARGAMAALLIGLVLGMVRLVAELNKHSLSGALRSYAEINFLHFAAMLFVGCVVILIAASLTAPPPRPEQVEGITFGGARKPARAEGDRAQRRMDLLLSGLLLLGVLGTWVYFSE
jgi:SSS family solute:Na+ symporter